MEENKAEIVVQPIKKIVTFECTELSREEFFKRIGLIVRSRQPVQLNWAEGVIFVATPYQPRSDIIVKEALRGNIYWSSIVFTPMSKYESMMKFGAFEVPIINQTSNSTLRQVAQWLRKKSKFIEKEKE